MSDKIYLIIGKNGQLGREFEEELSSKGVTHHSVGRRECDISNTDELREIIYTVKPDVVINCAAYNFVDKAEEESNEAFKINAHAVGNLASLCREIGALLIHYSTDYVFDGTKEGLYTEEDTPNPINTYGESKLSGETQITQATQDYLIFRVSWLYGRGKQNFPHKLLQWAKQQPYLRIAHDEFSIPTSTSTVVNLTLKSINAGLRGLFHLTCSGYASRYEWAKKILKSKGLNTFIYPVSRKSFNLPAQRPFFSAMSNRKISSALGVEIEEWEEKITTQKK